MNNYLYTTEVGTKRRRAKAVQINNPISLQDWNPSLTFIEEDRIILKDSEEFKDAGNLVVAITPDKLTKLYTQFDVETGQPKGEPRTGQQLLDLIFSAFADIYITEALERDSRNAGAFESYAANGSMVIESPTDGGSMVIGD